jgi:hypothetical protein
LQQTDDAVQPSLRVSASEVIPRKDRDAFDDLQIHGEDRLSSNGCNNGVGHAANLCGA